MATNLIRAESPSNAEQKPVRHGAKAQPCAEPSKKEDFQKKTSNLYNKNQNYANPPAGGHHANPATPTDFATASFSEAAAQANRNWADLAEDNKHESEDPFITVQRKKRHRGSAESPAAAAPSSGTRSAGATRRPRSSTGWAPRAEEIRTTRAHIAEARARQASSTEDHCVYVERSPELEPFHYMRAIERMFGGTREVFQLTKMNGHFLVGLANRGMAERLINEGLEVEGTLHRAFPFRKRAERITVGNLPFFVGDAAVISALSSFGRVTSIAPKLMKAGPYVYNDGRREAFIILREGMTIERLPTRLDISIKGEAWPAYLSSGIRCSRCRGQGHRRANCPMLVGRTTAPGPATPTSPTSDCAQAASAAICPASTSGVPQFNHGGLRRASREPSCAPSTCCTPAITSAPSALPLEDTPPAPPPVTPAPSLRTPGSREPAAPTPDVEMSIVEETFASSTSSAKNATRVDLDAFIEGHPSVSFAKTDALGLGREEVLDLLSSRTKAQRKGPLLSPPQCDALVGLIGQILDLRPGAASNLYKVLGQVKAELRTTPAVPPTPPLPAPRPSGSTPPTSHSEKLMPAVMTPPPPAPTEMEEDDESMLITQEITMIVEIFRKLKHTTCLRPLYQSGINMSELMDAVLCHDDRMSLMAKLSPALKNVLAEFLGAAIEQAQDCHPNVDSDINEMILNMPNSASPGSSGSAGQEPGRPSIPPPTGVKNSKKNGIQKRISKENSENRDHVNPPAGVRDVNLAAARDDVTLSLPAGSSSNGAARVLGNWADCIEDSGPGADNDFTVVKTKKRRRESSNSPTAATPSSNIGGARSSRRTPSSARSVPRAQEIPTTRAHIAEARARQASSAEEHCVYLEHGPELQPFHYLRALDRLLGGTAGVVQVSKVNGHQLLGLANRGLAERLINNGLEVEGTLLRAFPFRKRAERITVGNLPFFVEDSAIIKALGPYGRITSIAPKMMKAGPYTYTDGRREAFIVLHEGVTTDRLPTRLNITIKGEAWPACLSSGIKCSRCHGQGHRRANCPLLAGRTTAPGPATPTSPTSVPPATAPRLPQQPSAQPPPPASRSPTMEVSDVPPTSRAALHPPAALRQSPPAPSALPAEDAPPAPPPVTPAPSLRTPVSREPAAPTPDVEMSIVEETSASFTSTAKNATRIDLDAFIERHPSVSFAETDALGLGREEVLDLLSSRTKTQRSVPLLPPSQCNAFAGLIRQILDLRTGAASNLYKVLGQVKAELRTTPAVPPTPPLPAPRPAEPMLPTTHREELTPPLMTPPPPAPTDMEEDDPITEEERCAPPPPAPRLAGPIPPVPHGDTTTPAMTTPPPPLSMDRRWKIAGDFIHDLSREIDLEHTFQSQVDMDDIVRAVLYPGDREPFIKRLPTRDRYILSGFINTAIWRARDGDPSMLESMSELRNPSKAEQKPVRHGEKAQPCAELSKKEDFQKKTSNLFNKNQNYANPPAGGHHANPATPTDFVTASFSEAAAQANRSWADLAEDNNHESEEPFITVQRKKRRRGSAESPAAAAPSSNIRGAGAIRRPRSNTGWAPRAEEIRTTRAHIAEARARQASSTEDHCVYVERSPEPEPFHYMRAIERMFGGTREVFQLTKMNGHFLVGLANRGMAERLINEGLEVEGTLHRAFPFRKRAERITVGNLPFFVGYAAVISALSSFGRVTSIAPKLMKAGPYIYNDGRREAFIIFREGMTIERLPTRRDITIKGEAWPAYLSSGIRCSRCHGQGHRRSICPLLAGLANNTRMAPPTTPAGVPPPTTPAPPQRSAAQPPAPTPSNPAMEVCSAPPVARAALHSSAPLPSPPAFPMEETPPASPPVTPAPSLRTPGSREPAAPTPDVEMSIVETFASSTSSAKNATRVDLDAFIEGHPSVSFAKTDALGLGREEVLDLLSSRTKAQRKGPLLSPPQCDALAGLIGQILDLRPGAASNLYKVLGQVRAELRTTPAVPPTPPLPAPRPAETAPPAPQGEESAPAEEAYPPPLQVKMTDEARHDNHGGRKVSRMATNFIRAESPSKAEQKPVRHGEKAQPCAELSKKVDFQKKTSNLFNKNQNYANPPAGGHHANPATPTDFVTASFSEAAAQANRSWADLAEDNNHESEEPFITVQRKKRRRGSAESPAAAAPSSNIRGAGAIRRPRSNTGWAPRAEEIRTTRAHIAEARARQASSTEDHCVYVERSPEPEPFHYMRAIERMFGGTREVFQLTKMNGHFLVGLANRGMAERLINEGLEVEGTLHRAFPFRKRAERITVGNLPFFVGDAAVISALSSFGRVTSIAPKLMKAGPYIYNDGRREAFIIFREGMTIERLPTRRDITIKGEAWPAYLSSGIRCSRCRGQGHRRANCPLLAGLANNTRLAPPTTPAAVPSTTTSAPPQRSAAQPPTPASSSPARETPGTSPAARAVTTSTAPRPSPPVAPAVPMEEAPSTPPPVTPAPSLQALGGPAQRTLGSAAPTPDVEMSIVEETFASSTSLAKNATRVDLDAFIEGHPSVSFAETDALGLGREEVLDLLSSRTKAQRKGPLLSPPQCDALVGVIGQILNLRPGAASNLYKVLGQVKAELRTTPAEPPTPPLPAPRPSGPTSPTPHSEELMPAVMTPPPPALEDNPDLAQWEMSLSLYQIFMKEPDLGPTSKSGIDQSELTDATLNPRERINSSMNSKENHNYVNPPAGSQDANSASPVDLAAIPTSNAAAQVRRNWADITEEVNPGAEEGFTLVQGRKRRRGSANSPTAAAPSSNAGGSRTIRRPQPSAGSVPRAQEIRVTRAHIAEARARQASSSEEHCVYIEHSPELEPFHYLRALDRMLGGTAGVIQITKVNGHQLLGLTNRGLAERLISEGLEVKGTLLRAFPFRKRAERITVGNLPFFIGDSAVINALSPYGRVTSIAPKQMKAGPYVYVDGRRDVFITLHKGITIERLPTRLDINIKGEAWPAYLSSGIRCSRCHGQGHRRAICPLLSGLANNTRMAPPTTPAGVPPPTTPAPPQRSAAQPPPPTPSNPAMEVCSAPPVARAALHSSAPRPSPPAAPAFPMEETPPAPPPVTPAPSLRTPGSREPAAPTPDVEMSIVETFASSTSSAKNATRVDLDAFIEGHPSVSFAKTDALGLGREEVLDLLSSRTKAQRKGPLLSPPQCDALAGLIGQILDLRPGAASNLYKVLGQVRAELRTTPAVPPTPPLPAPRPALTAPPAPQGEESAPAEVAYPPPLPVKMTDEARERWLLDLFKELNYKTFLIPLLVSRMATNFIRAESPSKAEQKPVRHGLKTQPCAEISAKQDLQNKSPIVLTKNQNYANLPAGSQDANSAAPVDHAAISTSNAAAQVRRNWADITEKVNPGAEAGFTLVQSRKRRRGSGNSPTTAALSSNTGASRTIRRPQSSAGLVPRAQEIRATRAHIAEARARQASSSEEHCVYIEHSPELEPFHYLRALDRMLGGTAGVIQITKVNGHQLLGLTNRGLADRLISEGLEVEGTLLRAFPFRKRAERITVGYLPFFVGDSAVNNALSPYGRVTSIAPKQMKAGPYVYVDGRRDVFITLHEGITIERLPTRLDINIKGEAWPAFLSSGIRCSRCHGQGHRKAICPLLAGLANNTRMAPPTTTAGVPPPTTSAPPQRSAAQPPAPAPSNPAMEVCSAPPMARTVLHPSAPRPFPPAAPALPMEETPSAPPPVTPAPPLQAPEGPVGPRPAGSQHPEPPPARPDLVAPRNPLPAQKTLEPAAPTPDVEMLIVEETSASSTSSAKNATRVDLDAFIERHPSVSFAGTDALGLGREEVLDLLSSRTKAQRKGPLLSPPQCDALAGLIRQILDLRPGAASNLYKVLGQVKAKLRTTPAAVPPTPPLPAPRPAEPMLPTTHREELTPPPPAPTDMEEDNPMTEEALPAPRPAKPAPPALHKEDSFTAMITQPPPLPAPMKQKDLMPDIDTIFNEMIVEPGSRPMLESGIDLDDVMFATCHTHLSHQRPTSDCAQAASAAICPASTSSVPSPTMEVSDVLPASRAAPLPPAALRPSPPAPSALPVEDAPPASPPVTPAPSLRAPGGSVSPQSAKSRPSAQDIEMTAIEESSASSTSSSSKSSILSTRNATRNDLDAFIERHPSVSFAGTDALGLGREEVLDLLSSRTKAQKHGPLLSPKQGDALAGLIKQILDLRPEQAATSIKSSDSGKMSRQATNLVWAESPSKAEKKPARHGSLAQPCAELSANQDLQNEIPIVLRKNQNYVNPPAGSQDANSPAPVDLAAIPTSNAAAQVRRNWADITEEVNPGAEEGFTLVQGRKRRRGSANSPTAAAPSSNAGGSRTIRRPQPSAGSVPRAQEIRVTRAHIAEARARQASSSEEHCVYIEHSPELEPFHYLKALDRMLGGTAGVIQITKVNGHQLLGLTNRGLAERLISEGLEVEGTLLRAFPFRKRAERITVGNLPFFIGDSAVINALSPYERVTSIAPKQMKAGPYVYVDGRRDVFITLHEGITIERLPTRLDINIKGEAWPAYLSSGIRCSRCHGQGHRRAICPLLAGLANNTRMAPPTTPAGVPPPTTSAPPQRSAAQPPAPTPSNPAMEVCSAPPVARAVLHSSAPRPSPPAAPAFPMEETPPAPPPVTPAQSLRTPGSREPAAPTPDVEMSIVEETFASSTSSAKNATRVDLDAFIEKHPSVSFAGTDALGLGREEVLDLLSSRTKTQRKGPLLSPPQCDALAGLIRQILNLRPGAASNLYKVLGQVKAELRTTPAAVPPTPPLPAPRPAEPMLPTTHREELTPPLMTPPPPAPTDMEEDDPITEEERCAPPPPAPRLAGPIPPVPHGDTTTPAKTTPPPPLSLDRRWKMAGDLIHELSREIDLEHTFQSQVDMDDIVRAVLYPGDREPFIKRLPTRDRYILSGFINTAIWRARNGDPSMLE
ncbi:hypothetical protein LAZ67_8001756, partial [Cordylochernes scorpioides]